MEQQPHDPDEHEPQQPVPGEAARDPASGERPPTAAVEFGTLELVPPDGDWWGVWVITRGIAEAEREEQPIDHRTAYYIASYLGWDSTPALRSLARTGAIDMPRLQEEVVARIPRHPGEVQTWLGWLADYCRTRQDRGPVANWWPAIKEQDRVDAEWLRREQVFASLDELFQQVPPVQRVPNAGQPGWHGLVRHGDLPGGWIISEGVSGERRVWETDSDVELDERYVAIVAAQRQWVVDTFGGSARTGASEDTEGWGDAPDGQAPPPGEEPQSGTQTS